MVGIKSIAAWIVSVKWGGYILLSEYSVQGAGLTMPLKGSMITHRSKWNS